MFQYSAGQRVIAYCLDHKHRPAVVVEPLTAGMYMVKVHGQGLQRLSGNRLI